MSYIHLYSHCFWHVGSKLPLLCFGCACGRHQEAQLHGEVDLKKHVDTLVVNERHRTPRFKHGNHDRVVLLGISAFRMSLDLCFFVGL